MPTYEIEQYELHTQRYRVEATSEAEAIQRLFEGKAHPVDNGLEFVEVAEDVGLPTDEYPELARALHAVAIPVTDVIPSIRSVEQSV